jgi:hypothetical protein
MSDQVSEILLIIIHSLVHHLSTNKGKESLKDY